MLKTFIASNVSSSAVSVASKTGKLNQTPPTAKLIECA